MKPTFQFEVGLDDGEDGESSEHEDNEESEHEEVEPVSVLQEVAVDTKNKNTEVQPSVPDVVSYPTFNIAELEPPKSKQEQFLREANQHLRENVARKICRGYGLTESNLNASIALQDETMRTSQSVIHNLVSLRHYMEVIKEQTSNFPLFT